MARIVEYCGIRTIAGLTWDLLSPYVDPSTGTAQRLYGQLARAMAAPPAAVLLWGDRRAVLSDRNMRGLPALSQTVAGLMSEHLAERVVLVAIAEPDAQLYTAFVLAAGKPVLGAEKLLDDAAQLRAAVGEIVVNGGIDVIAASPALAGLEGLGLPRIDVSQTDLDPRALPVAVAGQAPLRSAATLGGAVAALAITASLFAGDVKALLVPPDTAEKIIPAQVPRTGSPSRIRARSGSSSSKVRASRTIVVDSPPGSTSASTAASSSGRRTRVVATPRRSRAATCSRTSPWRASTPTSGDEDVTGRP